MWAFISSGFSRWLRIAQRGRRRASGAATATLLTPPAPFVPASTSIRLPYPSHRCFRRCVITRVTVMRECESRLSNACRVIPLYSVSTLLATQSSFRSAPPRSPSAFNRADRNGIGKNFKSHVSVQVHKNLMIIL